MMRKGNAFSVFFAVCIGAQVFSLTKRTQQFVNPRVAMTNHNDKDELSALFPPPCPIMTNSTTKHLHLPIQGGFWIPNNNRTLYSNHSISWFQGWDPDAQAPCTFRAHKAEQNVLVLGDSTARHIYSFLNGSNPDLQSMKGQTSFKFANGNLTFSWRGRMNRETENCPLPCHDKRANIVNSTRDVQKFANRLQLDSSIVYSIGAHEIIGWTGRQTPTFHLDLLRADVIEFLNLLSNYRGTLVWWRPHDLKPGKARGKAFQVAKRNLKLLADLFESTNADLSSGFVEGRCH